MLTIFLVFLAWLLKQTTKIQHIITYSAERKIKKHF